MIQKMVSEIFVPVGSSRFQWYQNFMKFVTEDKVFAGPIVEERTITTTYEDDVAVNEEIVDRIVPLNEEEQEKWNRMVQEVQMNLEQQV